MCGIVGYIGHRESYPILINGNTEVMIVPESH